MLSVPVFQFHYSSIGLKNFCRAVVRCWGRFQYLRNIEQEKIITRNNIIDQTSILDHCTRARAKVDRELPNNSLSALEKLSRSSKYASESPRALRCI